MSNKVRIQSDLWPLYAVVFLGFLAYALTITLFIPMLMNRDFAILPADYTRALSRGAALCRRHLVAITSYIFDAYCLCLVYLFLGKFIPDGAFGKKVLHLETFNGSALCWGYRGMVDCHP